MTPIKRAAALGVKEGKKMSYGEDSHYHAHLSIAKYDPDTVRDVIKHLGYEPKGDELKALLSPDHVTECEGNLLTTLGLNRLTNLLIGGGGVAMSHANCALGVGDTATAATVADTQLGSNSATHSRYIPADATYPTQSNGLVTINATFGTSDGNFVWAEWGIVIATTVTASDTFAGSGTSPILLNHKIAANGTKVNTAIWVPSATLTWS